MARCKHLNCTIQETAREHILHTFEDGELVGSGHYEGDEFAMLWVSCQDCGLSRGYSKYNAPVWLDKLWNSISEMP